MGDIENVVVQAWGKGGKEDDGAEIEILALEEKWRGHDPWYG